MTPVQQDILRASLEKTTEAFFRKRAAKTAKIVLANGSASAPQIDATGLLVVLAGWVGDMIANAPEDMRDNLFLAFADSAADIAGIKEDQPEAQPQMETLQ